MFDILAWEAHKADLDREIAALQRAQQLRWEHVENLDQRRRISVSPSRTGKSTHSTRSSEAT